MVCCDCFGGDHNYFIGDIMKNNWNFGGYEDPETKRLENLSDEFRKVEEEYREQMDSHMRKAKEHLNALFELSEISGLPFNFEDMSRYFEDYKRWTTVYVPDSFHEKFSGLSWTGKTDDYDPRPWKGRDWIASGEC